MHTKTLGGFMSIKDTISQAGKNCHTIILTAMEEDGSVEKREGEPYSYRVKNGHELFFCFDIKKQAIRSFVLSKIISVEETDNVFKPRWPIEV